MDILIYGQGTTARYIGNHNGFGKPRSSAASSFVQVSGVIQKQIYSGVSKEGLNSLFEKK